MVRGMGEEAWQVGSWQHFEIGATKIRMKVGSKTHTILKGYVM